MTPSRRTFIKNLSAASALAATGGVQTVFGMPAYIPNLKKISPNDKIRIKIRSLEINQVSSANETQ